MRCMTDCDWARSSHLLVQQVLEFSSCCRYLPKTSNVGNARMHPSNPVGLEPRSLYLVSAAAGRTSLPDGILALTDSLRGSSVKIGTTQRRLAWPLRKDDTLKSGSVLNLFATFATRGCWQQLVAPKNLAAAAGGNRQPNSKPLKGLRTDRNLASDSFQLQPHHRYTMMRCSPRGSLPLSTLHISQMPVRKKASHSKRSTIACGPFCSH